MAVWGAAGLLLVVDTMEQINVGAQQQNLDRRNLV
jgi:hypothetical protein